MGLRSERVLPVEKSEESTNIKLTDELQKMAVADSCK